MNPRTAAQLLRPPIIDMAAAGLRYGRQHGLDTPRRAQIRSYIRGRHFGLELVPPMRFDEGLVVDVGANVGDFTAAMLALDPRVRVLAIEPSPAPNATLRERFAGDSRVRVDDHAISSRNGTAVLHVTETSHLASLHAPKNTLARIYGDAATITGTVTVPTARLDDVVDEPVSLLKIDVQGAEADLLAGAAATLGSAKAVLLEVTFIEHYHGDTGFAGLYGAMAEHGFRLVGLGPMHGHDGLAVWCDACFARFPRPAATR